MQNKHPNGINLSLLGDIRVGKALLVNKRGFAQLNHIHWIL